VKPLRIGLIGDFDIHKPAHRAIPHALTLAAKALPDCHVDATWVATSVLAHGAARHLAPFAGLWCAPGSPYTSFNGALNGIQYAREKSIPFLATCGGFQHAILEYARHALRIHEAEHAESNPKAILPFISLLTSPIIERDDLVRFAEGSRVRAIYNLPEVREVYHCSYGLPRAQEGWFKNTPFKFTGRDRANEARVFELDAHPFYIGTLYQPERSSLKGRTHPLITAFLQAIIVRQSSQ
jgi:CTP synthase (UTP-ammonia lyase)